MEQNITSVMVFERSTTVVSKLNGVNIDHNFSINTYKIHWYKYAYREIVFCGQLRNCSFEWMMFRLAIGVLHLQSQNAVQTGFNTLHQSEFCRHRNKTDTQCHRSKAPYTLQQRTQVTGSVVYKDIAMSPNDQ